MNSHISKAIIFLATITIVVPFMTVYSADQDMFDIYNLEVEGYIHNFVTGTFNDDDLTDIAVIYSPHNDRYVRYLGLYLQKISVGFRPRADYLVTLTNSTVQIDVHDIDEDGLDEILTIDADGVAVIKYGENGPETGLSKPQRLIRHSTIYGVPYFRGIIAESFVKDISDQPGYEIIMPVPGGYVIYEFGDNGVYQILNQLSVPLASNVSERGIRNFSPEKNLEFRLALPKLHVIDGNLDGRNDLYFLWKSRICCFFQDSTGNFTREPDHTLGFVEGNSAGYLQSYLVDCNGDARPDVVVTSCSGGVTSAETKLRVYTADTRGYINPQQFGEISLSDSHCNLLVNDYNTDDNPEIIIQAVEMGTIAATKIFLTKKADLHLLIYTFSEGLLKNEPDERLKYEFRFNFDDVNPTGEVSLDWSGNYNEDGLFDAAFCDGNGRILFFWGDKEEYLSQKPDLEITLDHPSAAYPVHLNQGTYSDIIVEHNLGGRYDRLTVLKNRNNRL